VFHVLVVVENCVIIFVLVGFPSSPNLLLGFRLDLRSANSKFILALVVKST
jgi:hypothetical protein